VLNTLHERKLCSKSRTSQQTFVSVYRVYLVRTDNIFVSYMWNVVYYVKEAVYDLLFMRVLRERWR
jgi:hypothetical protein